MQQIADWLQKLGLGQYAQTFAENEIDVSVLPHLTDQDLKDIGVPLGPRRKILAAITAETGTTNATPEPAASIEPKAQDTAERRQVTVMFSDLVGSTALSARPQPRKGGSRPRSIEPPAKSFLCPGNRMRRKRKRISSVRSRWRASSKQSPGNCARR
jgi:hypothetical protein